MISAMKKEVAVSLTTDESSVDRRYLQNTLKNGCVAVVSQVDWEENSLFSEEMYGWIQETSWSLAKY